MHDTVFMDPELFSVVAPGFTRRIIIKNVHFPRPLIWVKKKSNTPLLSIHGPGARFNNDALLIEFIGITLQGTPSTSISSLHPTQNAINGSSSVRDVIFRACTFIKGQTGAEIFRGRVAFDRCTFHSCRWASRVESESNILFESCLFSDLSTGIQDQDKIAKSNVIRVSNSLFHNCSICISCHAESLREISERFLDNSRCWMCTRFVPNADLFKVKWLIQSESEFEQDLSRVGPATWTEKKALGTNEQKMQASPPVPAEPEEDDSQQVLGPSASVDRLEPPTTPPPPPLDESDEEEEFVEMLSGDEEMPSLGKRRRRPSQETSNGAPKQRLEDESQEEEEEEETNEEVFMRAPRRKRARRM
eukprot:GABV01008637.1.p1 GENE.GABV01008637.1~~GABV01008637.1.p1  ORF type:complete len:408 (-),score=136.05 GABV01008637.1:53-1135(-)